MFVGKAFHSLSLVPRNTCPACPRCCQQGTWVAEDHHFTCSYPCPACPACPDAREQDVWVAEGLAAHLEDLFLRKFLGHNELAYR